MNYHFYKAERYLNIEMDFQFYRHNLGKKTGIAEVDAAIDNLLKYINVASNSIYHTVCGATHIASTTIKKESVPVIEDLDAVRAGVLHFRHVYEQFEVLKRLEKSYKAKLPDFHFDNPMKSGYKKLMQNFSEDGEFLGTVQESDAYSRFSSGTGYALYFNQRGVSGFLSSTGPQGADIASAKLFQNLVQANNYAKDYKSHAIVEVNINFLKLLKTVNCDVTDLQTMMSRKESLEIENQLKKFDIDELAEKLLNLDNVDDIKKILLSEKTVKSGKKHKL